MSGPYKIVLFDDSCNVYLSLNTGSSFAGTATPTLTLGNLWTDLVMAVNDGDSDTIVAFAQEINPAYNPPTFAAGQGGVSIASLALANLASAPILNYSRPSTTLRAVSGATTALGHTILAAISDDSTGTPLARLTKNSGATWTDVTSLGADFWEVAAFSANAAVMYIFGSDTGLFISTNGGTSWTNLPNAPAFDDVIDFTEQTLRIRCSQNGQIVAMMSRHGFFYLSKDSGNTWAFTDFTVKAGDRRGEFLRRLRHDADRVGFLGDNFRSNAMDGQLRLGIA